jgi:hypothetical protein
MWPFTKQAPKCEHHWVELEKLREIRDVPNKPHLAVMAITYVLKCDKCGDMKNHRVESGD